VREITKGLELKTMKEYVRILVADDEPVMRNLLVRVLETEGYQVTVASTIEEGRELLKKEKFDILLADAKMPGPSGIELLKRAKALYPDMAVIVMIAYGEAHIVKEALLNGADEYVTKPFKSHEISLIVERAYWRLLSVRNAEKKKDLISVDDQAD
jgi:DNA-binding NtrC family response regulator